MKTKPRSSNDQKSDARNPNNKEHLASIANRANQMNPNNTATKGDQ